MLVKQKLPASHPSEIALDEVKILLEHTYCGQFYVRNFILRSLTNKRLSASMLGGFQNSKRNADQ